MRIILILAILLVSACGNQPIRRENQEYQGLQQAQADYKKQNFALASIQYEKLYQQYGDDIFVLKAADSYLQAGYPQKSAQLLNSYHGDVNHPLYAILKAQIAINKGDYTTAQYNVNLINQDKTSDYYPRFLSIRATIYNHQHNYLDAALDLIELSAINSLLDLNTQIITNLLQVNDTQLTQALFDLQLSELQKGWIEAAYAAQSQDAQAISQWQANWQNHPAHAMFLNSNNYDNVAVLLPMSGKYRTIAKSIQQGMIAALFAAENAAQSLHFFDTGSNGESFSSAWYSAIESGAQFIIGPLDKQSIQAVNQLSPSSIPVLLLNKLAQEDNPNSFYQFSLSPEDDVRNIADRLNAEHKKQIMLLAPDTQNMRELAAQFEKDFAYNGGKVMSYGFYPQGSHDFSNEIKKALGLYESQARIRHLQALLGTKLNSEAQIRPDIDAIVLLAKAKQIRLIKPQLKFFQAQTVPVYTTSSVYSSSMSRSKNKDLEGIRFPQSQFVIDASSMQNAISFDVNKLKSNKKYFAFGYDAISLYPRLEWMRTIQNQKMHGMSGDLSMDLQGVIHRQLSWAEFDNEKVRLLPPLQEEQNLLLEAERE